MSASAPGFGPVVKADAGVRAAGERALHRTFLLLDVLPDGRQWRAADRVRAVILAAGAGGVAAADVDSAAGLLALAVSYRHSVARHVADDPPDLMERELTFIAEALMARPAAR